MTWAGNFILQETTPKPFRNPPFTVYRKAMAGTGLDRNKATTSHSCARGKGLVLPGDVEPDECQDGPVVWNGRCFHLARPDASTREMFTYNCGQHMVGQTEQPCASTTRLVGGRHRFINAPDITKEGHRWSPGHRYTNRVFLFVLISTCTPTTHCACRTHAKQHVSDEALLVLSNPGLLHAELQN
jgi:hypothetical protein